MNLTFLVGNFCRSLWPKPQEVLCQLLLNLVEFVGTWHLAGFDP